MEELMRKMTALTDLGARAEAQGHLVSVFGNDAGMGWFCHSCPQELPGESVLHSAKLARRSLRRHLHAVFPGGL